MHEIESAWELELRELQTEEESLAAQIDWEDRTYSGLRDIGALCSLATVKLRIVERVLGRAEKASSSGSPSYLEAARKELMEARTLLEELMNANISEDQKSLMRENHEFKSAVERFGRVLLAGGGILIDDYLKDDRTQLELSRAVAESISKFVPFDENYPQYLQPEKLPRWLRGIARIFASLIPEYRKPPPYDIDEGREETYRSKKIRLPLSQAVLFYEDEVLPELYSALEESPTNPELRERIHSIEKRVKDLRNTRYLPRSNPIPLERGVVTDMISGFTEDGEAVVTVELPVVFKSGTPTGRLQELVTAELVRKLSGRGICPELDAEYRYLKHLDSGIRGSSLFPGSKLNVRKSFRILKMKFPVVRSLENEQSFRDLVKLIQNTRRVDAPKRVRDILFTRPPGFGDLYLKE